MSIASESRPWLWRALRLAISVSLIVTIVQRAELDRAAEALRGADAVLLALAFVSYFVGYAVSVARWRVLLAVNAVRPRFGYLYWSFMVGVFFNQLLPSTIGGDLARYQYTAAGGRAAALSAVVLDRALGTVVLFALAGVGLVIAHNSGVLPAGASAAIVAALIVGVIALGSAFLLPEPALALLRRIVRLMPRVAHSIFGRVFDAFAAFQGRYDVLLVAVAWSLVLQAVVIAHYCAISAALDLDVPLHAYVFIVPIATVITALPISINGIGVREGILGYLLGLYGVDAGTGLVFAWIAYALLLAQGVVGGLAFALVRSWRRERSGTAPIEEREP